MPNLVINQGGENATCIFFTFFLHFVFWPEVAFLHFLHLLDAILAKEKLSHRIGSYIFLRYFYAGVEGAGGFFFKCNMRGLKGNFFGSCIFFCIFCIVAFFFAFLHLFCIAFLRGQVAFSPPPSCLN
jgi:hypothetical protein